MGIRKFVSSLVLVILVLTCIPTVFCVSGDWVEVTSFNGTIWPENTDHFMVDYFDWRIKWSYTPRVSDSINPHIFRLDVKNASGYVVEFIFASNQISGTVNMNQTGEYYLYIDPLPTENYSITIEQNKNSIPQSEANWVEVDSVAGNGAQFGYTSSFDINHIEWRIKWEYTPLYDFGTQNDFGFSVVPEENKIDGIYTSNMSIASVKHPIEQNGTLHFNNLTGTFYLYFSPGNTNWKISIEENITSIPEFPSWIILPLFISVTLTMLFVRKKIQRKDLE